MSSPEAANEPNGDANFGEAKPETARPRKAGLLGSVGTLLRGGRGGANQSSQSQNPADTSLGEQQQILLANVIRLGEMRVSDAMVPRADVVAIDVDASLEEAAEAFRSEGHSRLPVYKETLDDALGFIHVKDVFMASITGNGGTAEQFSARRYLRRFLTVPPSMPCASLLEKMQAERLHLALVIDEYGGVDGLVTIEDLLELIVGDIEDEHDTEEEADWSKLEDGTYRAAARSQLDEFSEETGVDLLVGDKFDDVDTLGGLVFMLCNRVPARGEVIEHPHGHEFEVLDADPRKIKILRVTLSTHATADGAKSAALEAAQ